MLLPQANSVSPSTVLLSPSTTPSMCRRLTTSEAAAPINTALTTKPRRANSWRTETKAGEQRERSVTTMYDDLCVTYWVIFGGALVGGGAKRDGGQEQSQEKHQQPDRKLTLDQVISICTEKAGGV